jgi:uncharacterized membrane protein YqaE (UPF0057 family)
MSDTNLMCDEITDLDNQTVYHKVMDGGLGYGTICIPANITRYIIMVVFPPLSVFLDEWNNGFKRIDKIIINFILTAMFYFPGLLHALSIIECDNVGGVNGKCG